MLSMKEHQNLLLVGVKFEKLKMVDNAKKIYTKYVTLVGEMDRRNVIEFFYGSNALFSLEVTTYEEAINKALVVEKLKRIFSLVESYPTNWNGNYAALPAQNKVLIDFLDWASKDIVISNDDIKVLDPIIDLLEKNTLFNITCDSTKSLMDVLCLVVDKTLRVNIYRNEVI